MFLRKVLRIAGCIVLASATAVAVVSFGAAAALAQQADPPRIYENHRARIEDPKPILADYPEFFQPVLEADHYEAPVLVDDRGADLSVRAWRFSYNVRGIIEIPNRLQGAATAVIVVHPWGIDDGQGWRTPQPAGCAFQCTPTKNQTARRHAAQVIDPLLKSLRGRVAAVIYSLPGREDPIRRKVYRSIRGKPTEAERAEGRKELHEKLHSFVYRGESLPESLTLSADRPVVDYFRQFPGLDAGAKYNAAGFWDLPVPVMADIETAPADVVVYDAEGYDVLRQFLAKQGVRHVLLAGYNTDMCVRSTTAGYENLRNDFNVFLVGDATMATSPANQTPACATNAAVSFAALNLLITQVSWIQPLDRPQ
jgi:hypothetical protein